ncbi:hypothetical protein ASPVEDRAFT_80437 [Aspergillus versicolor CBS 583.65]|uniref:Uncharacterized protein n=1 Tax=Aspergillus versicolor CBS 583.65 TaxID=1036611 RepID=A0A1L9PBH0_ASPVE|nr:uncharacterized protein ASPVEDRAFT_80437 [Aspergillus versicolor CBS 583.65]OJI98805.1 hypothetical protein ASPVEDRAFT_80437 [Aspergillus versicolor CBS 583.65]
MADPFSIAASVAGILSLGIESCKLIVKYCDDFHGADDQIESIALKAGGLSSTLQQINTLLKETDGVHPKIASDIREKVLQNETWITKINKRVANLSMASSSNGLSDKLRATAKKAAFPLKKNSLIDTVEILQGLQMNLHTALLTLQIQHVSALSKQTELIERVESLVLVRTGQLGMDMGRMELAIRNTPEPQQQQVSRQSYSMPCVCSNNMTRFGHGMEIRRKCPRHKHFTHTKTQSKSFTFTSSWFGLSIEAAISISKRANGLSISPTLHFHAIVPDDSPAFELMRNWPEWAATAEEIASHFNMVVQELQQLFDQGRATPFDRTADGETLLHTASFEYFGYNTGAPAWNLIKYLVEAGCPINEENTWGHLAMDVAISNGDDTGKHVLRFLELGAVLTGTHLQFSKSIRMVEHLWSHNREAFYVSDAAEAVLSHSKNQLKHHLELARDDQQKLSKLYELCSYWADGIRILHEAGGEIPTSKKNYLLQTAIWRDSIESAQAFVDIGAVAESYLIPMSKSKPMEDILIQDLVSKGKHLLMLAKSLPPHVQLKLELQNGHLPDRKAQCIVLELESRGIPIDPWFRYYNTHPVFCEFELRPDQMERLYQAGFRDVDAPDSHGYTPLMQANTHGFSLYSIQNALERIPWLVNKGASLDAVCQSNGISARSLVIFNIVTATMRFLTGYYGNSPADNWDTRLAELCSLLTMKSFLFQQLLGSKSTNEAQCFCSVPNGSLSMFLCFATNIALYVMFRTETNTTVRKSLSTLYEAFLTKLQIEPRTSYDIIRLLTFTDLGLTHTCWHIGGKDWRTTTLDPFDEKEATEIRDEERYTIEELEDLVVELQREYNALEIPLWEYIQKHWCDRMSDYLEKHGDSITDDSMCSILRPSVLET